jgi:uncharacterized protein
LTKASICHNFISTRGSVKQEGYFSVLMYEERFYREWSTRRPLERYELKIEESDLLILFDSRGDKSAVHQTAKQALKRIRRTIKQYIQHDPRFSHTLSPIEVDAEAPPIIQQMAAAGQVWNVGPMAAVAGVVAEYVARRVQPYVNTVLVENGGDIFAISPSPVRFALYAGEDSPFGGALTFETPASTGVAICTSSGRIGPSLSMGRADAVAAIHPNGAMADAAATATANRIQTHADVGPVVEMEQSKHRLRSLIACMGDKLAIWGDISLIENHIRSCRNTSKDQE